jgi:hypothetical protein
MQKNLIHFETFFKVQEWQQKKSFEISMLECD